MSLSSGALLEYPQSGERIKGRQYIRVHRIVGSGDLWVTDLILPYEGHPSYPVSIMGF